MKRKMPGVLGASSAVVAIILATPAFAQDASSDAGGRNDEIVVTAQKREQSLQDVSGSIAAVSGADIAETGKDSFADYVNSVPGLSIASQGPGLSTIALRGVTTGGVRNDEPQNKETVGVYIDETPVSVNGFNPDLGLYDIARIEVLRGPQGTLYGSGSMGGTIRIITNKPDFSDTEGSAEGTLSFTRKGGTNYGVKAMVNVPLVTDTIALRAIGYHSKTSGYIDNDLTGEENVNDARTSGARVQLGAKLGERVGLNLTYMYHELETGGRPDQNSAYKRLARTFDGLDDRLHIVNGTFDVDLGGATLTSSTSYVDKRGHNRNSLEFLLKSALGFTSYTPLTDTNVVKDFSQEIRLASDGSGPFSYVVGAFYQHRKRGYQQEHHEAGFDAVIGAPSTALGTPETDQSYFATQDIRQTQKALFAELSYKILPELTATAGLRYFHFKERSETYAAGALNGRASSSKGKFSEDGVTPKFNLSYELGKNNMVYAQAVKGFRLGGVNGAIPVDLCRPDLDALGITNAAGDFGSDSVWNYEVGSKNQFLDRRLTLNVSGYYIKWKDMQTTLTLPSCSSGFRTNVGKARSVGLEIETRLAATDSLDLYGTLGFTDSRLTEDVPFTTWEDGDTVPAVPRWQISAGARQGFRLFEEDDSYVRADYNYVSRQKNMIDADRPTNRYYGDYHIVNLQAGTAIPGTPVELSIFARNLLDSHGRVSATAASSQAPERFITVQPRTIGATAQMKF